MMPASRATAPSPIHPKLRQLRDRDDRRDLDPMNPSQRWPLAAEREHRSHGRLPPREQRHDRAVRFVAHRPGQAQPQCLLTNPAAEPDTLYPTGDPGRDRDGCIRAEHNRSSEIKDQAGGRALGVEPALRVHQPPFGHAGPPAHMGRLAGHP
jgi:hypothetical protein